MAKGKKNALTKEKSKKQENTLEEEIKDTNIMNLYNINKLLMFDTKTSIKNKAFTTYKIEDSELAHPLNSTFISEQYENMVLMPEFSHLYTGNIGKFRFCVSGFIEEMNKYKFESKEEQFATIKLIKEILSEIIDTIDYVLKSNKKELAVENENEFCKELVNFLVAKATEKNLTSILNFSCKEVFSLSQDKDNKYIFIRELTYSNYNKVVDKLINELSAHKCVADECINMIGDLLFTPPRFLLAGYNKYKADIKNTQYSISVVKNFNWFLWDNCNNQESEYYFCGDSGRYRYCLQILIKEISRNYSEISVNKIDEVLNIYEKIYSLLYEIDNVISDSEHELYSMNQLSIFVCSLMSEYHLLEPAILDFVQWCDSPYIEWDTDYYLKGDE